MWLNTVSSWGIFLGLLLCWPCSVSGKEHRQIGVSITGRTVALTCPESSPKWYKVEEKKYVETGENSTTGESLVLKEEGLEGQYTCVGSSLPVTGVFVKIRVCDSCLELSLGLVAGIVVSDLLVTLGVLLVVYYCRMNRVARLGGGAAGGGTRGWPHSQKTDSPPPVPNPDYEPIRKGQREVYAGLEASRAF